MIRRDDPHHRCCPQPYQMLPGDIWRCDCGQRWRCEKIEGARVARPVSFRQWLYQTLATW